MGVINATPDSFSGDGIGGDVEAALALARRFVAEGADIIDVGGESTRPEALPISAAEELRRVLPVVERLAEELPVPISIDTYKAEVARHAIAAGAQMINDVWGLKRDPQIAMVASEEGVPLIIAQNQRDAPFRNLFPDIITSLEHSIQAALKLGVNWDNIIIDPGIGFGKTLEQNLELLRRLGELRSLARPILIGPSRKFMLRLPPEQRLEGTAAAVAIGIANGADAVRVHDVAAVARVCRMSDAIVMRLRCQS
jgi:dihydropteroate synthase